MISKRWIYSAFILLLGTALVSLFLLSNRASFPNDLYSPESIRTIRRNHKSILCPTEEILFDSEERDYRGRQQRSVTTNVSSSCHRTDLPSSDMLHIRRNYVRANKQHPWYRHLHYCQIKSIAWSTAHHTITESKSRTLMKRKKLPVREDFILAECFYHKSSQRLHQFLVHTYNKRVRGGGSSTTIPPSSSSTVPPHPDVLIMHLGEVDVRHRKYQLPITSKLLDEWQPIRIQGINSLGPSVRDNLVPLIMGQSVKDIQHPTQNGLLSEPLWQHYRSHGYATLFAENTANYDIFKSSSTTSSKQQPPLTTTTQAADHYLRPFWLAVNYIDSRACINGRARHEYVFDYLRAFFTTYRNEPKLAISVHHEYAENNLSTEELDSALAEFFTFLQQGKKNFSQNLIILLLGSPQQRLGLLPSESVSHSEIMRHLMLYGELVLPQTFKLRHSSLGRTIIENTGRLVSAFDLHHTVRDFLTISQQSPQRHKSSPGDSLLREMPIDKNCHGDNIDPAWCTCVIASSPSSTNENGERAAGRIFLTHLNRITNRYKRFCQPIGEFRVLYSEYFTMKRREERYLRLVIAVPHNNEREETTFIVSLKYDANNSGAHFSLLPSDNNFIRLNSSSSESRRCTPAPLLMNDLIERACICDDRKMKVS